MMARCILVEGNLALPGNTHNHQQVSSRAFPQTLDYNFNTFTSPAAKYYPGESTQFKNLSCLVIGPLNKSDQLKISEHFKSSTSEYSQRMTVSTCTSRPKSVWGLHSTEAWVSRRHWEDILTTVKLEMLLSLSFFLFMSMQSFSLLTILKVLSHICLESLISNLGRAFKIGKCYNSW